MIRKIVRIHEEKCNGCELCVKACHEGAIVMVDGKARLVSDKYCDGFGDCLPACPTGAIEIIERDADEYSQEAVDERLKALAKSTAKTANEAGFGMAPPQGGCPGKMQQVLKPKAESKSESESSGSVNDNVDGPMNMPSELMQWPVQLRLINPQASFLEGADVLIAADCTAFAYANIHQEFMKDRVTIIGCPKLDDQGANLEKLTAIFKGNRIKSVLVLRMEVPCCSGIVGVTKDAIQASGKVIPYAEVTISTKGERL